MRPTHSAPPPAARPSDARAAAAALALALSLPLFGCGPTGPEAGTAVGLLGPLVLATTTAWLSLLRLVWRHASPVWLAPPWRTWVIALLAHAALALFVLVAGEPAGAGEWLGVGLWAFGTSHLAVALVAWRIWFWRDPAGSFVWGPIVASALLLPAALPLAMDATPDRWDGAIVAYLWLFPGYVGWVPGGLLALLLGEAGVRALLVRRRDRAAAAAPPPDAAPTGSGPGSPP